MPLDSIILIAFNTQTMAPERRQSILPVREVRIGEEFSPFAEVEELPFPEPGEIPIPISVVRFKEAFMFFQINTEDMRISRDAMERVKALGRDIREFLPYQPFSLNGRYMRNHNVVVSMESLICSPETYEELSHHAVEMRLVQTGMHFLFGNDMSLRLSPIEAIEEFNRSTVNARRAVRRFFDYMPEQLKRYDFSRMANGGVISTTYHNEEETFFLPYDIDMLKTIRARIIPIEVVEQRLGTSLPQAPIQYPHINISEIVSEMHQADEQSDDDIL